MYTKFVRLIARTIAAALMRSAFSTYVMASCLIFYTVHCTTVGTIVMIMNTITAITPAAVAITVIAVVCVA